MLMSNHHRINHIHFSIYRLELEEKFAKSMTKSGMAITITSVTDLFAFGIGSYSDLPILSSFSLYAAVAIFSVYLYMTSFFLAWFYLDQCRIADRRNGCFCFYKSVPYWIWRSPNSITRPTMDSIFGRYASVLVKPSVKFTALLFSIAITVFSTYEATQLDAHFDSKAFLPNESYFIQFVLSDQQYFHSSCTGILYVTNASDISKLGKINNMLDAVEENGEIIHINSFIPYFAAYVQMVRNLYYFIAQHCTFVLFFVTHCIEDFIYFLQKIKASEIGLSLSTLEQRFAGKMKPSNIKKYLAANHFSKANVSNVLKGLTKTEQLTANPAANQLQDFLCSKLGRGWRGNIQFERRRVLNCSQKIMPKIEALLFQVEHRG